MSSPLDNIKASSSAENGDHVPQIEEDPLVTRDKLIYVFKVCTQS